ncbi:glycosyl hydrolase 108 family protein [Bartonella queenslandensis]|uniref:glycosyl hydrolase 108 family protein n=1 Tax=Bartonella queenslandensis TaxID=481138 RepID=UPI00030E6FDC|nr:glycosyl hydrolase 108 family protein [Bartonella queenslandensis]
MAKVPILNAPEVAAQTTQGQIQASGHIQSTGGDGGQQISQLGHVFQDIGAEIYRVQNKLQNQLDDARVNEKFSQYLMYVNERRAEYSLTQGKNAIEGYGGLLADIQNANNSFKGELDNERQRFLFKMKAQSVFVDTHNFATKHSLGESFKYSAAAKEANISALSDTAVSSFDLNALTKNFDHPEFVKNYVAADKTYEDLLEQQGYAKGTVAFENAKRKFTTDIVLKIAQKYSDAGRHVDGLNFLESQYAEGKMDLDSYTKAHRIFAPNAEKEQIVNTARGFVSRATEALPASFHTAYNATLDFEGRSYVQNDSGSPSFWGLNAKAHPEIPDVSKLTEEEIKKIYYKEYWLPLNADNLPEEIRYIAFDTAVNMGVKKTLKLLKESEGDPNKFLDLRQNHYESLVKQNPEKYGKYQKGWAKRVGVLREMLRFAGQRNEFNQPRSQPLYSVLSDLRAYGERKGWTPDMLEKAEHETKTRYLDMLREQKLSYDENYNQAAITAFSQRNGWKDVAPEVWAQLMPQDRVKLQLGSATMDDPETVSRLVSNPDLLKNNGIYLFGDKLTRATMNKLMERYGGGNGVGGVKIDQRALTVALVDNGLDNLVGPTKQKDKRNRANLELILQDELYKKQASQNMPLSPEVVKSVTQQVLNDTIKVNGRFLGGATEYHRYQLKDNDEKLREAYVEINPAQEKRDQASKQYDQDLRDSLNNAALFVGDVILYPSKLLPEWTSSVHALPPFASTKTKVYLKDIPLEKRLEYTKTLEDLGLVATEKALAIMSILGNKKKIKEYGRQELYDQLTEYLAEARLIHNGK